MAVPVGTVLAWTDYGIYVPLTPTHYVSTSGTASWANATNPATPCSASTAMTNAVADNVVQFAAGRYSTTGSGTRYTPALLPANSGTVGHPIIFQADGVVDFQHASGAGPVFGVADRNYVTWRGFRVDEALCPRVSDSGPVVVWGDSTGNIIEYCEIDGNGTPADDVSDDNLHTGIWLSGISSTARYNYIHHVTNLAASANGAGVLLQNCRDNIVEHNEIANCSAGVFHKHSHPVEEGGLGIGTQTVRLNSIHDCGYGIRIDQLYNTSSAQWARVSQNLVKDCIVGLESWTYSHPNRFIAWGNNTVIACGQAYVAGGFLADAGHQFFNNLIVGSTTRALALSDTSTVFESLAALDAEHNVYHDYAQFGVYEYDVHDHALTLASWKALGQDSVAPAAQNADPLFVNAAGSNYRLQAESPARDAGIDILNLQGGGTSATIHCGCYVTGTETIGRA